MQSGGCEYEGRMLKSAMVDLMRVEGNTNSQKYIKSLKEERGERCYKDNEERLKFGLKDDEAVAGRFTPNSSGLSFVGEVSSSESARRCRDFLDAGNEANVVF